jgi:putative transposase
VADIHPDIDVVVQAETIQRDLREIFRGAVRTALELVLEEELQAIVGAGKWARAKTRVDSRNGTYLRKLMTSMGHIEVAVPRSRGNGSPTHVVGAYKRRTAEIDDTITSAYVNGVSTRGMSEVTEALMGDHVKRSTVSRITQRLEEHVESLRATKLESPIPYLFLDATFLDVRWANEVQNVSALVAYGVNEKGHRELLGVTIGAQESEDSWSGLLKQLVARGLHGVRLVISDEHEGLKKAVRLQLPEAKRQRCYVHLLRNIGAKLPKKHQERVLREASAVFHASTRDEAKKKLAQMQDRLAKLMPAAIECLTNGFDDATQFYAFPKAHWTRLRSTNGLERLHGEIKRRTRAVGVFPDAASALRLVTATAIRVTEIWGARKYLDMKLLT